MNQINSCHFFFHGKLFFFFIKKEASLFVLKSENAHLNEWMNEWETNVCLNEHFSFCETPTTLSKGQIPLDNMPSTYTENIPKSLESYLVKYPKLGLLGISFIETGDEMRSQDEKTVHRKGNKAHLLKAKLNFRSQNCSSLKFHQPQFWI